MTNKPKKIFFTSDHHFDHYNIIKYASRPFKNVSEMNDTLVENWNEVVGPNDTVWYLGDFMMGRRRNYEKHLDRLEFGEMFFIRGNHDQKKDMKYLKSSDRPITVMDNAIVHKFFQLNNHEPDSVGICMSHQPLNEWCGISNGIIHAHGHTHELIHTPMMNKISVCPELHDYYPVELNELVEKLNNRQDTLSWRMFGWQA